MTRVQTVAYCARGDGRCAGGGAAGDWVSGKWGGECGGWGRARQEEMIMGGGMKGILPSVVCLLPVCVWIRARARARLSRRGLHVRAPPPSHIQQGPVRVRVCAMCASCACPSGHPPILHRPLSFPSSHHFGWQCVSDGAWCSRVVQALHSLSNIATWLNFSDAAHRYSTMSTAVRCCSWELWWGTPSPLCSTRPSPDRVALQRLRDPRPSHAPSPSFVLLGQSPCPHAHT
jgi:hypothetical protein